MQRKKSAYQTKFKSLESDFISTNIPPETDLTFNTALIQGYCTITDLLILLHEINQKGIWSEKTALLAQIQEEIPKVSPELLQLLEDTRINIIQGRIYQDFAKVQTIEDVLRIKQRLLLELVPVLPAEDRAEIKAQIELEFADPQNMLDLHRQ